MKKLIRDVDEKRGIVQITTYDERWYAHEVKDPITGIPTVIFVPSVTWVAESYPKGIAFYKWLADKGWDEAEAIKEAAGDKGSKVHHAIEDLLAGREVLLDPGSTGAITINGIDTGPPCTPPAAPTGVSASAAGANQINLSWQRRRRRHRVLLILRRRPAAPGPYTSGRSTTSGTSFSNTSGLTCNTTYFYVRARPSLGCESANSAQVSATTARLPVLRQTRRFTPTASRPAPASPTGRRGTFVAGGTTLTDWQGIQTCTAQTGARIFRFGGNNCTANYGNGRFAFAQPNGATRHRSARPARRPPRLSFGHRVRRFESGFDGLLRSPISVNGANYFFLPAATIISGASYNGTTSNSPLPAGGRRRRGGVHRHQDRRSSARRSNLDAACNIAPPAAPAAAPASPCASPFGHDQRLLD